MGLWLLLCSIQSRSLLLLQVVVAAELLVQQKLLHRHKPLDQLALLVDYKVHQLQQEGRAR